MSDDAIADLVPTASRQAAPNARYKINTWLFRKSFKKSFAPGKNLRGAFFGFLALGVLSTRGKGKGKI
jgi:hypothetical protein